MPPGSISHIFRLRTRGEFWFLHSKDCFKTADIGIPTTVSPRVARQRVARSIMATTQNFLQGEKVLVGSRINVSRLD